MRQHMHTIIIITHAEHYEMWRIKSRKRRQNDKKITHTHTRACTLAYTNHVCLVFGGIAFPPLLNFGQHILGDKMNSVSFLFFAFKFGNFEILEFDSIWLFLIVLPWWDKKYCEQFASENTFQPVLHQCGKLSRVTVYCKNTDVSNFRCKKG